MKLESHRNVDSKIPARTHPAIALAISVIWFLAVTISLAAAPNQLNLFIWSEYIDPQVVKDFEQRYDCHVAIDLFEDDATMLAKLQGGGASVYDVVVAVDHRVPALIQLGLIGPLRREHIPNLRNLQEKFRNPPYDRGNVYTAAYQWGTLGVYVRTPNGQPPPPTWGLIFDPKLQPTPFVLMDSARDLIGAALKFKGHSLNSTDPAQLKEARDLILAAKARCLGFDGSVGAKNKVLSRTANAAMVYNGEAARGISEDKLTAYVIPKEGSQIWVDNLAILAKAPHRDLAETFVNFLLDGQVGARISNYTQFATPNQAALAFIKNDDLKNPAIYPSSEVMARLEFLQDLGANGRLYDEVWTQIKSK